MVSLMKTRIIASIFVTSWQIEGEKLEAVMDFIFLSSRITWDGNCSHEIKRHLLLGRKTRTNLDSVLKTCHHFTDKSPYNQSYGFPSNNVWIWEFIFLGFKTTADGDCSHEIKRCLLLGGKAVRNLDSILKNRDITLLTKTSLYWQRSV